MLFISASRPPMAVRTSTTSSWLQDVVGARELVQVRGW